MQIGDGGNEIQPETTSWSGARRVCAINRSKITFSSRKKSTPGPSSATESRTPAGHAVSSDFNSDALRRVPQRIIDYVRYHLGQEFLVA